jgi:nudix-type nucleoside diphosphatase (YffH/AdpP family)
MKSRRGTSITLHGKRRVFDRFLKIDEITYAHDRVAGRGRLENRKRLVMERGDAAAALLHETDTDLILLTRQVRAATIERGPGVMREILAGVIEAGETPQACIRREIMEEIGYRLSKTALRRIGMFYVSPGGTSERIHLFYAPVASSDRVAPDAHGEASEGEDVVLAKVSRDAFVRQALTGRIDDAKTLIAGLWLAHQVRKP